MYNYNPSGTVAVRMRVLFGRAAVGGPASMPDSVSPIERLKSDNFFQIPQLALSAPNLQALAIAANSNSGRIVAAILQAPQAINNDRNDALLAYISHDSAGIRSEEHTSELQSRGHLVCRLLLVKK